MSHLSSMDSLPKEILIHVLSYLQGEDVVRFKQLNSRFQKIVSTNRKCLKHPKTCVDMYCYYDDPKQDVYIFVNNCWLYRIIDLKPVYTPLKQWARKQTMKDFFGPFFERKLPDHDLQAFFEFVLEKGDVTTLYLNCLRNARAIAVLTEAIKRTPSQIERVLVDPFRLGTASESISLLKAVGSHKRKTKRFPIMRIHIESDSIRKNWTKLRTLNTIASRFSRAQMECPSYDLKAVLTEITKEWQESPFPIFHFQIFSEGKSSEPWKIDTDEMEDDFKVTVDDESKIVRFEDVDYGDFIQFQKMESVYDHYGHETLDTVDIAITAHLE